MYIDFGKMTAQQVYITMTQDNRSPTDCLGAVRESRSESEPSALLLFQRSLQ